MPGTLYRRGGIWWAALSVGGRRRRVSTRCRDRRAAEAIFAKLERELAGAPRLPEDEAALPISRLLADLVAHARVDLAVGTARCYLQKSGHLLRLLGTVDAHALDVGQVRRYIATRLEEGAARETVRKELTALRQAMKLAGLLAPIPDFKVRYQPRRRWLTADEVRRLLAVLPPHRQAWVVVAVFTGARDSEVDGLDWLDVDLGRGTVLVRGTKTEKAERVLPLPATLRELLWREKAWRDKAGKTGGPVVGEWRNVRRDLAAACKRAGISRCSPNDLRRTYASWLKQAGIDSFTVATLLGHSSSRMVELVYGRIDLATLSRAVSSLPGGSDCVGFVPLDGPAVAPVAHPVTADPLDSRGLLVVGGGIEPSTRGFSVRVASRPEAPDAREVRACLRLVK